MQKNCILWFLSHFSLCRTFVVFAILRWKKKTQNAKNTKVRNTLKCEQHTRATKNSICSCSALVCWKNSQQIRKHYDIRFFRTFALEKHPSKSEKTTICSFFTFCQKTYEKTTICCLFYFCVGKTPKQVRTKQKCEKPQSAKKHHSVVFRACLGVVPTQKCEKQHIVVFSYVCVFRTFVVFAILLFSYFSVFFQSKHAKTTKLRNTQKY
jgi:hypothetical protein